MIFGIGVDELVSIFVILDIFVAFAFIARGLKSQDYGMTAGGAMCGLIALSSSPIKGQANVGKLILLILGLILGLSPNIIRSMRDVLNK